MLARKAIYGLKSSGTVFRSFLAETLDTMGYRPSYANPCLWLRPAVKTDGSEYSEYILCCVDDMLSISHNTRKSMKKIQEDFNIKDNNIGPSRTKEKGTTGNIYILIGELEYVVFLP